MPTLSNRVLIVVLILLTTVCLTAPVRAQRTAQRHHQHHRHRRDTHMTRATNVSKKSAASQAKTTASPEQPPEDSTSLLTTVLSTFGLALLICVLAGAWMHYAENYEIQLPHRKDTAIMTREFLATTRSAEGLSKPRASGISADLQQIALQYTQVTGKGLIGGYTELLRQNTQASLEAKGVAAAVRRLDNRDRIVNRLAQSIRAEDGLKETVHQYELNEILREQKHKAVRSGSPMTPSLPPAAAPASLPSAPVQPYSSPDRLEGLALHGVLIYRTEGQESFARFAAALSHDLGRNEAAVVTRRMDEMLSKLDSV